MSGTDHGVSSARRSRCTCGYARVCRLHRAAILRLAAGEAHRARTGSRRGAGDRAGARFIHSRRREDDDPLPRARDPPSGFCGRSGSTRNFSSANRTCSSPNSPTVLAARRPTRTPPELREDEARRRLLSAGTARQARSPTAPSLVIDVLRTTSTICAALYHGARAVVPAADAADAARLEAALGPSDVVLAGERNLVRIPGFQLGNSPLEMTADVVSRQDPRDDHDQRHQRPACDRRRARSGTSRPPSTSRHRRDPRRARRFWRSSATC